MHTWTGDLQSSAVRLTVAAGSEEAGRTEVQAAGSRPSDGGAARQADAVAGRVRDAV